MSKKPLLMALFVAGVFAGGIGVGMLMGDRGEGPGPTGAVAAGPGAPTAPRVDLDDPSLDPTAGSGSATSGAGDGSAGSAESGGPRGPRPPVGTEVSAPPPPPPPIPPEALADAERLKRERDARGPNGDRGHGKVTTLVYDFETDEERQAWEAKYKKRWETRLKREIDIKIRQLRETIGLSAPQESKLRTILDEELTERSRLVELLTAKKINQTDFDQAVQANVGGARQQLRETLTEQQLAAYNELKPREQVLRDEIK